MSTNYSVGHEAERLAAEYLKKIGFKIRQMNWRTKHCEIDIVAEKDETIFLVEVKYRSNDNQGEGFNYITPAKLRQMKFAAEMWVSDHEWSGQYTLGVLSAGPDSFEFIEDLT